MQPNDLLPLFLDLPERATTELLDSIERESRGEPRNWAVRKYLRSLPVGVHHQSYELHDNGATKRRVDIGDLRLAEMPLELPSLRKLDGRIAGVGFEPGRTEVRVKSNAGTAATLDATAEQVDAALRMRNEDVRILGVSDGKRTRLLNVVNARTPEFKITDEAVETHIFKRWERVFARLASE